MFPISRTIEQQNHENDSDEDKVSVKLIKEYLEMDKQKNDNGVIDDDKMDDDDEANCSTTSNSDDSSTESIEDDVGNDVNLISTKTETVSLSSFSDNEIFNYLLSKHKTNEILERLDASIDSKSIRFLTGKLSTLMKNNAQIETSVLDELAESHSEGFLEHALTENMCSVVCDKLSTKSPNELINYMTSKINNEKVFASEFLKCVSPSILQQSLCSDAESNQIKQLLDGIHKTMQQQSASNDNILPKVFHEWIAKLFSHYKLTANQYLQLTSIYIKKNPPDSLKN